MTAKSLATKVDWSKITSKVSGSDVAGINKFKSRVDANAVKANSLPESLPKIDWAFYKANASDPKLVEEIEKTYNSIKIERPVAPQARLNQLAEAEKFDNERYKKFAVVAQSFIDSSAVVKKKFEKMIPVKDMSVEDWALTFPMWSISIANPTVGSSLGRTPGLSTEEQIAFEQPDPLPFSTKKAWEDWEKRKAKFYSD